MTNKIDIDLDAAEMSEFIAANGGNDIKSLSCDSQNPNTSTLDNALVNAVIHWKELELDFFIFAISKINPFSKNFDGTLRLSLRDFADIKSRDYSYLIKELRKKTVGELLPFFAGLQSKMVIKINDKSIDQHGFEPSAVRTIISRIPVDTLSFKPIFGGFEVDLKQGEIELKFMEWLLPYVSDINENFTSIHTKSLINLKGVQSKQLLMLMMMIPIGKGVKEKDAWVRRRTFSRAEYKEYLGMSENSYIKQDGSVDYKNFRARGVKTVMQRINDSGKYLLQVDFKDQQADFFTITMIPNTPSKQLLVLMMMIPIGKGVKEKDAWVRRRTFSRAEYKKYLGISENSYIKQDGSVDYKDFRARGVETVMQRINDSGKYLLKVDFKDQQADFFTITMIPS